MFVDEIISSFLAACHHYCAVPRDWGAEHCRVWLLNSLTLWLFNIAMENGPFIDGLPIKNGGFSMAMLNNKMVTIVAELNTICLSVKSHG